MARPRAFRLKDQPSVIIFRDRSVLRDGGGGGEEGEKCPQHGMRWKRREARREDRLGAAAPSRGTSERIAEAAIARSVSLASVSAWLRPTFLHLAGERPLRFFVPRLNVSFRRRLLSLLGARRGSRDPPRKIFSREFPRTGFLFYIRGQRGSFRRFGRYARDLARVDDKLYFLNK